MTEQTKGSEVPSDVLSVSHVMSDTTVPEKSANGVNTNGSADPGTPTAPPGGEKMTQRQIIKNLLVVSVAFLFLFTAFQSSANLQTSLNPANNVGAGSLAVVYVALILSCLFIPPPMIAKLGCKWTIPVAMTGYVLYMVANFYPHWGTMGPAAFILGLGAAPLWSAKCTYLTETGVWYARMTGASSDAIINRFFGIFFMIFQTSQIWGNLISSVIFKPEAENGTTLVLLSDTSFCGANFCPHNTINNTNLRRPEDTKVYIVCGVFLGCAIVGMVIVSLFLDVIKLDKDDTQESRFSPRLALSTVKHLISSKEQMLLIPLTIYSGLEQAFVGGDYTKSFISCTLGIWNVGFVMITYGVTDAICSFTFGRMVQCVGHIPFFVLAVLVHGGLQITFLFWMPQSDSYAIFFVLAALWGMGDAVIQTQINALYGHLFSDNSEAAFANYRLWESLGFAMTYIYNDYLCTSTKLYICLAFLGTGMLGYTGVEVMTRNKNNKSADITKGPV